MAAALAVLETLDCSTGAMFDCPDVVDRRPAEIIITHPGNLATEWKKATPSRGCYLPGVMGPELLSHGHRGGLPYIGLYVPGH